MKLQKVIAAYFQDLADKLNSTEFDHECLAVLMKAIMHIEECKMEDSEKKAEPSIKKEECKDSEDCSLINDVMSALGLSNDFFDEMTDDKAQKLGGTKIKIRIIPKKADMNKILTHFRDGGVFTLEAAKNDELGEIFGEEMLTQILDMPIFKLGGPVSSKDKEPSNITQMKAKYGILDEDVLRGKKTFTYKDKEYRFVNGLPTPVETATKVTSKKENGGLFLEETTLEDFLNEEN